MSWARRLLLIAVVGTSAACAAPLVRDARAARIGVHVLACDVGSRFVRATVAVSTSTEAYDSVVVVARLSDTAGEISHSSEVADDVEPGRPARLRTTLRVLRPPRGTPTCTAELLYANP